jgi:hypothetical protein
MIMVLLIQYFWCDGLYFLARPESTNIAIHSRIKNPLDFANRNTIQCILSKCDNLLNF